MMRNAGAKSPDSACPELTAQPPRGDMNKMNRKLRAAVETGLAILVCLTTTLAGFVITANHAGGNADAWLAAATLPGNLLVSLLMWGLAGCNAGTAGVIMIRHSLRNEEPGPAERTMDHPAFALVPAALLLAGGALGHLAARAAT